MEARRSMFQSHRIYPPGCGTKYVMDEILTVAVLLERRLNISFLLQLFFFFLIGFVSQISRLAENESTTFGK